MCTIIWIIVCTIVPIYGAYTSRVSVMYLYIYSDYDVYGYIVSTLKCWIKCVHIQCVQLYGYIVYNYIQRNTITHNHTQLHTITHNHVQLRFLQLHDKTPSDSAAKKWDKYTNKTKKSRRHRRCTSREQATVQLQRIDGMTADHPANTRRGGEKYMGEKVEGHWIWQE